MTRIRVTVSSHTTWVWLFLIFNPLKLEGKSCVEHLPTELLKPGMEICLLHTTLCIPQGANQIFSFQVATLRGLITHL